MVEQKTSFVECKCESLNIKISTAEHKCDSLNVKYQP